MLSRAVLPAPWTRLCMGRTGEDSGRGTACSNCVPGRERNQLNAACGVTMHAGPSESVQRAANLGIIAISPLPEVLVGAVVALDTGEDNSTRRAFLPLSLCKLGRHGIMLHS